MAAAKAASLDPDVMEVGGSLADNFDGTIIEGRYIGWDYGGNRDRDTLGARLRIEPDDLSVFADQDVANLTAEGYVEVTYSAGKLASFAPSLDGDDPVDLDDEEAEGYFAAPIANATQLSRSSNWADFITKAREAGFDGDLSDGDIRVFEGVHGHFDLVPQKKRSGIVHQPGEDGTVRERKILVLTAVTEGGKAKPAAKAKGKAKAAPKAKAKAAAAESDEDFDSELAAVVVSVLGKGLKAKQIPAKVMGSFNGSQKALAVKRAGDSEFLGSEDFDGVLWSYDAESGEVTPIE